MCAQSLARLALVLTVLAVAWPAQASASSGGKITGRVTDSDGHGLVLGAAYAYRDGATTPAAAAWIVLGSYALSVPADDDYKVYFADALDDDAIPEFYDDKRTLADANPITVRGGATVPNIDARLMTGGRIAGRVRSTSDAAIPGAVVAAYDAGTGAFRTSTTTDAAGRYTLPPVDPGSYKLYFVGPSGGRYVSEYYDDEPTLAGADPVAVTAGRTTTVRDAILAGGGTISGTVTGDGGRGLANAVVAAYTPSGTFVTSAVTASSGAYQLPPLPDGGYKIRFVGPADTYVSEYYDDKPSLADADTVTVASDRSTTGIDAALSSGGRITGRVTTAGEVPVDGATVFAYRADTGAPVRGVYTGADGRYRLDLDPGSYKLIFAPRDGSGLLYEYYDDKPTKAAADPVVVTAATPTVADATLDAPGRIWGYVRRDTGGRLAAATVTAYTTTGTPVATTSTAPDGTYTIDGLTAGTYKIGVNAGGDYIPEYYRDKPTLAQADPITVRAGRMTPAIASLAPLGAFGGRVIDHTTRQPIAGAIVNAYTTTGTPVATTTTDTNGTYTLPLAPGAYKLHFAGPTASNYLAEYHHDATTLATARTRHAYPGRTINVSEQLTTPLR